MDGPSIASAYSRNVHKQRVDKEICNLPLVLNPIIVGIDKQSADQSFAVKVKATTTPLEGTVFCILFDLSVEYPFKPPKVRFENRILHPNVDKEGELCIPILSYDNWKATCTLEHVILSILVHLNEPDINRPVSLDATELYIKNRPAFFNQLKEGLKLKSSSKE